MLHYRVAKSRLASCFSETTTCAECGCAI